jgi:hypothetical protein
MSLKLSLHIQVVLQLSITGAVPLLPVCALIMCTGTTLPFTFSPLMFASRTIPLLACNINYSKLNRNSSWLTEIGCRTICKLNGMTLLRKFCARCPDDKRYDPLLARVCYIINICLDRKQLPVHSSLSPATFTLPTLKDIYSYSDMAVTGISFTCQCFMKQWHLIFSSCFSCVAY